MMVKGIFYRLRWETKTTYKYFVVGRMFEYNKGTKYKLYCSVYTYAYWNICVIQFYHHLYCSVGTIYWYLIYIYRLFFIFAQPYMLANKQGIIPYTFHEHLFYLPSLPALGAWPCRGGGGRAPTWIVQMEQSVPYCVHNRDHLPSVCTLYVLNPGE